MMVEPDLRHGTSYLTLLRLLQLLTVCLRLAGAASVARRQVAPEPRFLPGETNVTVREGGMAILPCSVENLGTKQVAWRLLEGDFLTVGSITWIKDGNFEVEHEIHPGDITIWNLIIRTTEQYHAGLYECQITSIQGYNKIVRLNVVGPRIESSGPPVGKPDYKLRSTSKTISVTGKDYVEMGEPIRLTCNATGGAHTPEDIDWFKDGDKIDSHKYPHIVITKYRSLQERSMISELIVDRSTARDSGNYICRRSREEIVSLKVTVLLADTTNVKRGTGSLLTPYSRAGSFALGNKPCLALALLIHTLVFLWIT